MATVGIPNWGPLGVIPPIDVISPTSVNRSPYRASLTDFVLRFSASAERQSILRGLLGYRAALHKVGLVSGFQWINGSFMEHVEATESRAPNDVDVVTFFSLPGEATQETLLALAPSLFDSVQSKAEYHVDAYVVCLNGKHVKPEDLVAKSAYWYSVWSHRRNLAWKGYVEIDLDPADDEAAARLLYLSTETGGKP